MTSIANWINKEDIGNYSIWCIGDSKVTNSDGLNLTLENSKVFELPIICRDLRSPPDNRRIYYSHSIGFSYAGSSLVGLNCYATLNTMLSNLVSGELIIPNLFSVSETISKVVTYYCQSITHKTNPFEALVYGYCNINEELERYHIIKNNSSYKIVPINEDTVFLLGDKKDEIYQEIQNDFNLISNKDSTEFWRSPLKTLSRITTSNQFETIGGGTQLNIADKYGCKPYQAVGERKESDMKFRNINIHDDIGIKVGNCFIAISGMDYEIQKKRPLIR